MLTLKDKLTKEDLLGTFVTIPGAENVEILANAGFDWLIFDLEHSMIDLRDLLAMISVAENKGVATLVRVPQIDMGLCKRVLDAGCQGIMFPMIADANQAEAVVQAVKYPPRGVRGVGLGRAQGYGAAFEQYLSIADKDTCIIVQIETAQGLNNLEEIIAVSDIDIIFIGTADLKKSLGLKKASELEHHVRQITDSCLEKNITVGTIEFDVSKAKKRFTEGFRFIAFAIDSLFYLNAAKKIISDFHNKT